MRCTLCSGIGLVMVEAKNGYHVYRSCPACKGDGVLTPPSPSDRDDA